MKVAGFLLLPVALALYLLTWPTGMEPVAWTPPPAPPLEGAYAYNEKLKAIQKLAQGVGVGPAGVHVDDFARVLVGYEDGRIVLLYDQGASYLELADTGGRPLGITSGPRGSVVIADARRGLLSFWRAVRPLVEVADGIPLGLAVDADHSRSDWTHVYFTDASSKFGPDRFHRDFLEHGANGRLLQYDVGTKATRVLAQGLHFPGGVAVGPGAEFVLVAETGEYRILRYWLKGARAGTRDAFVDNLPGFPAAISFNGRDRFWLALSAPRDARLDGLLPGPPFLRHVAARLPLFLLGPETRHAFVLGLDLEGKVVANLQYRGGDAYAPITCVREAGPWLYFGSAHQRSVGRLPLRDAVPDAPAPPPGWEQVPAAVEKPNPLDARERGAGRDHEEEEERRGEQE